jgi:hypothetical protein
LPRFNRRTNLAVGEGQRTGGFSRLAHEAFESYCAETERLFTAGGEDLNDNLYIAGASFRLPIRAVRPTMTIITNALRAADRIKERLE